MHKKILIIAGAGMSVDSKVPMYHDHAELWDLYPYYKILDKSYHEISNARLFLTDPRLAWGFYASQIALYDRAMPHSGYYKLLDILKQKDYFVVTTNVDNLFLKAGFDPYKVHCVHGSVYDLQCSKPCSQDVWHLQKHPLPFYYNNMTMAENDIPLCPKCNAIARPNIFMFGDHLHSYVGSKNNLMASYFMDWLSPKDTYALTVIEIGVGGEGLRRHAIDYCKHALSYQYIVINPLTYDYDVDVVYMQGKAIDLIELIEAYL